MAHSILIALLVVISALTKTRIFALHFSSKTINYRATKYNKCNGHHQLSRLFSSSDTDKVDINQSQESIPVSPQRPQDPYRSSMPLSVITEPLKVMSKYCYNYHKQNII